LADPVTPDRDGLAVWCDGAVGLVGVLGVFGGAPGGEELEGVVVWRAGYGGVGGEGKAGLRRQFHGVEVDGDEADDGVAEGLAAVVVQADVVLGPGGAEFLAAGGEFADEAGQVHVVRGASGLGAQQRDGGVHRLRPVGEEVPAARVKELEAGDLSLDRSIQLFERGMSLSDICRTQLEEAETRVEILIKRAGEVTAEPFSLDKG